MSGLQPITPEKGKELFLAECESELSEHTRQNYHYRLKPFVRWCQRNDIENLNSLNARHLHEYKTWRRNNTDIKTVTLKGQLSTLRVFIKFLESIEGVEERLHEKILIPDVDDEEAVSNTLLESERADEVMDYLKRYKYASKRHALFATLWDTGCRIGAVHAVDCCHFDADKKALTIKHQPDLGTRLKNGKNGERVCALSPNVAEVLSDYIEARRDDVTDDQDRKPLFTTRNGRMGRTRMRQIIYAVTRPCYYSDDCPHNREIQTCEANKYDTANKCPSSVSPHDLRRGRITNLLRNDTAEKIVSERVNTSLETLEKHYSELTEEEKMEKRREHIDGM
jgi:integrase